MEEGKDILETGTIYFFYRPKVVAASQQEIVHAIKDVQHFYIVLHPHSYVSAKPTSSTQGH